MSISSYLLKDGRPVTIREASSSDAAVLLETIKTIISTSDFTLTTPAELDLSVNTQAKRIDQYARSEGHLILIAIHQGQVVGTLDFKNGDKLRNRHWGEFGMGVIPAFRGLGLGRLLLQRLLDWAEEEAVLEKVCLGVYADHHIAYSFYQKMGFVEEGRLIKAIKLGAGHYADEVRMYRWVGTMDRLGT